MKPGKVRAIALCIFERDGKILVGKGYDSHKAMVFGRPLGGTIEFGEHSYETIIREIKEELGAEVTNLRYLCTLENIFEFDGKRGHEIIMLYHGDLTDAALYERPILPFIDNGVTRITEWIPLNDFRKGSLPLYPTGLLDILEREIRG